ncbi:hydantoinase B/oxoprolinase family protein, partial [bacterium]|nr:hydantoinase B/oxoprolinase family protein [bacterium]
AITLSAVFYVMRCLLPAGVPTNDGLMRPLEVVTRAGSLVDASHPAAVAGGNVETSQRIVDVLLAAFAKLMPGRMPAASQGTMNNVTLGGIDPSTGQPFAYYETIGGGHGGHPDGNGLCGRHAHMTNSLNTPIETLEHSYPLRVRRYSLRRGSGGGGLHQGGDGLVRELEFLAPGELTLLTQRRISGPPGLSGGRPGKPGRNILLRNGRRKNLPGTASVRVQPGDRLVIKTPGGGGWGNKR